MQASEQDCGAMRCVAGRGVLEEEREKEDGACGFSEIINSKTTLIKLSFLPFSCRERVAALLAAGQENIHNTHDAEDELTVYEMRAVDILGCRRGVSY